MQVAEAITGQGTDKVEWVITVINTIDIGVVDIEQQLAVGLSKYGIDEIDLIHLLAGGSIVGDVFDGDGLFQNILHPSNPRRHIVHRLLGEGDRHQVIEMTVVTAVAEVFAIESNFVLLHEVLNVTDKVFIQRCRTAK